LTKFFGKPVYGNFPSLETTKRFDDFYIRPSFGLGVPFGFNDHDYQEKKTMYFELNKPI